MCEGIFRALSERKPHPLVGKIGAVSKELEDMPLNDYVESLDAVAKLGNLGIAATDDPYASGEFQDAMGLWPPVHIFCYFIERPGVYTQQELLQWKQLDAYNYFKSGFVRAVKIWDLKNNSQCLILKGLVNPSMRSPDNAHQPWVATTKDGAVVTAHCTCMAG